MKKILGSLMLVASLAYSAYRWDVTLDKEEFYVGESLLATLTCRFDDASPEIFIEMAPVTAGFTFSRLGVEDMLIDGKRKATYTYVVKATTAGTKELFLTPLMRKTTKDSIKERTIGRDNVQQLVFEDTPVKLVSKKLRVKPVPQDVTLLGNFTYTQTVSKTTLAAFEPLQLQAVIEGVGDLDAFAPQNFDLEGVTVYAHEPQKSYRLTPRGFEGRVVFRYALIAEHNYTLPAVTYTYFDPQAQKMARLEIPQTPITVANPLAKEALVDAKESPVPSAPFDWKGLVGYAAAYALGAASWGAFIRLRRRKKSTKEGRVFETVPELIAYLIETNTPQSKGLIDRIESDRKAHALKSVAHYVKALS